ncbi:MAG: hypothetical protein KA342_09855 [Aminivibrio sp.]|nr:hypothetical protein [Aminivibrio sp.]
MAKKKIGVKPPEGMRTAILAQTVLAVLFLPAGAFFAWVAEGEARPFALFFALVWTAGCCFLFFRGRSALKAMKEGTFALEVSLEGEDSPASRLRELESLLKDRLITEEEYEKKRAEILEEKW